MPSRRKRSHQRATPAVDEDDEPEQEEIEEEMEAERGGPVRRREEDDDDDDGGHEDEEEREEEMGAEGGGRRTERRGEPARARRISVAPSRKPAKSSTRSWVRRGKARKPAGAVAVADEADAGAMANEGKKEDIQDGEGGATAECGAAKAAVRTEGKGTIGVRNVVEGLLIQGMP